MVALKTRTTAHPAEEKLACYLSNSLPQKEMERIEAHLSSCARCLDKAVAGYDAVKEFNGAKQPKKNRRHFMKKINPYLALAVIAFALSFITPRFFMQLLVATVILGTKWVVDAKSTKMLVMIYEAWKTGGEREASRILETLETRPKPRF